jgi:hypothetical protein
MKIEMQRKEVDEEITLAAQLAIDVERCRALAYC